jgi:predicted Zn finger-like uncharacterized protein
VIVTCERCATQFQLDDSRVPARGVRVRCSRCKNAFRVVPPGQRAAEEASELARRAREDSQEEITQDLDGDSRGDSRSRSGSRRSESAGKAAESTHGSSGSGLDTEESDWKFNEDVSAEAEAPLRSTREEPKPEPPPARRGAEADDWFRGGSDAPLELDDRPWNAEEPAPESEVQHTAEREPEPDPEPEPAHVSTADTEPSLDRFVEPDEPVSHAVAPLHDELDSLSSQPFGEPGELGEAAEPAEAQKPPGSTDELSSDSWDQVFGDALQADAGETAEAEKPRKRKRSRSLSLPSFGGVGAHVGRWLGHGAQALGWLVTTGLFGAGLYTGLAAQMPSQQAPAAVQVGGLELAALEGRFVENAVSGRLYVVSGRVRNPSSGMEMLGLEVELLDAGGQPIGSERVALHAPLAKSALRESPVSDLLAQQQASSVPLGPGEERAVEGLFAALPPDAAAFRVVASRSAR